jgi:four helix bundle protein
MHDYKKLEVWKESVNLVTEIYLLTNNFPDKEKFGLSNQINRSAVSIPSNIAEGAGRLSKNEFIQFLGYAIASSYELETQMLIAYNLKFISIEQENNIMEKLSMIQRKLHSLIKSLKK